MALFKDLAHILRRSGPLALVFLVIASVNDQYLNRLLEKSMSSSQGPGFELFGIGSLSLLNNLFFPTLATLSLFYGMASLKGATEGLSMWFSRVSQQIYIETLRSWGSVMAWSLLLILPGLVRLLQLLFVPYIVVFHAPYQRGQADALQTSTQYMKRHPFQILLFTLIFSLLVPLTLTGLTDPWRSYQSTPLLALLCTVLDLVFLALSVRILFQLFDRTRQELGDESVLPVERHSLS